MHELSIALSIVEMACGDAESRGGVKIDAVHLQLGQLSGVVKEALLFSYSLASEGTRLEGSRLEIEDIPAAVFCPRCDREQRLASIQHFCCPVCGIATPDVRAGRELLITGLELSE